MLKNLRQSIVHRLWQAYRLNTPQMQSIENKLHEKGITQLYLDHFAVIDLPGPQTGIRELQPLFSALGYTFKGQDYLADKQNDFAWLCEDDSESLLALETLPQVVVADFRLDELPTEIKKIIEKYSKLAPPSPTPTIQQLAHNLDVNKFQQLMALVTQYLIGRDWPLPTVNEFYTVQEFNELLAWVFVFGRRPNHFTLSVHLFDHFSDLADFSQFVEEEVKLTLNRDGGAIKGGTHTGIAQGSTLGITENIRLADGYIQIPTGFVEFVWRYPRCDLNHLHLQNNPQDKPKFWNDYFTGFVAQHANRVIESLYTHSSPFSRK